MTNRPKILHPNSKSLKTKSLHNGKDLAEIFFRIGNLNENSKPKWGKMTAAQMLKHCSLVLEIPLQEIELPKTSLLVKSIGIFTKHEMKIFNNGIPPNMPTFSILKVEKNCNFEQEKGELFKTLNLYQQALKERRLPEYHQLFGEMTENDWGFLEYKHLHHHLKQFGV